MAHQKRYLTKALVREAAELYLESLAEEIADGEWVDLKGIGKIQVIQKNANTTSFPLAQMVNVSYDGLTSDCGRRFAYLAFLDNKSNLEDEVFVLKSGHLH